MSEKLRGIIDDPEYTAHHIFINRELPLYLSYLKKFHRQAQPYKLGEYLFPVEFLYGLEVIEELEEY